MKWSHRFCFPFWASGVFCAICASPLDTAFAQELVYPISLRREWQQEFTEFTVENYRGLMQTVLTPQESARLRNVRFEFPVESSDQKFNFRSISDSRGERVEMPVASLLFFKDIAFVSAWLSVNGYSTIPVLDYVSILAHGGLAGLPQDKRFPKEALGIPKDAGENPKVMKRYENILLGMVLYVVGHELGHIMHDFEGFDSTDMNRRRQSERDADLFALELFRRMNLPPIPVSLFFAVTSRLNPVAGFAGSEENWRSLVAKQTHPLDGERIQAFADFVTAHRPDFEKGFLNSTTATVNLMGLIIEFGRLARGVDDRSLSLTQADCAMTYTLEDLLPRKDAVLNIVPRSGERFAAEPWSGVFEGTVVGNKLEQSTAIRLILRREGTRLSGDTQYLCFRGRVDGSIKDDTAVVRWKVGNIRRTLTMHTEAGGAGIRATWRSDTDEGGDGTVTATRVLSQ